MTVLSDTLPGSRFSGTPARSSVYYLLLLTRPVTFWLPLPFSPIQKAIIHPQTVNILVDTSGRKCGYFWCISSKMNKLPSSSSVLPQIPLHFAETISLWRHKSENHRSPPSPSRRHQRSIIGHGTAGHALLTARATVTLWTRRGDDGRSGVTSLVGSLYMLYQSNVKGTLHMRCEKQTSPYLLDSNQP